VVKGAVLRGMAIGAAVPPKITICPRRYGFCLNVGQEISRKQGSWTINSREDEDGRCFPGEIKWMVKKGEIVFPESQIKRNIKAWFQAQELKEMTTIAFVASSGDVVPRYLDELTGMSCPLLTFTSPYFEAILCLQLKAATSCKI
jgi:hypothetical protein